MALFIQSLNIVEKSRENAHIAESLNKVCDILMPKHYSTITT